MLEELKIQLDFRHKIPLSDQVQNQLRGLIQSGMLQSGNQLPTVRQLAAQLSINFNTVARAYRVLDEEGWISTQQGRGTYVLEASARESLQPGRDETSDKETAQHDAVSPTALQGTREAAAPEVTDESSAAIQTGDTPISGDIMVSKDSIESTARDTSIISDISIASDTAGALTTPAAVTVDMLSEMAELEKGKAISEWIERLINEAAQNHIAVEDLYHALGQRLVSTRASVERSPRKAITRQPNMQSHKPLHQHPLPQEKSTSHIRTFHRKKVQRTKK